uniref:Uncharacterized protein n=1 Tax=Chenopodium quinoa TaxID=63459 RepID=A0A803MST4_CHEQI
MREKGRKRKREKGRERKREGEREKETSTPPPAAAWTSLVSKDDLISFATIAWTAWSYQNLVVFSNPWSCDIVVTMGYLRLVEDFKKYAASVCEDWMGLGAALRDSQGKLIAAIVKRVASGGSVKCAEAMAARMGYNKVELELDALGVVNAVRQYKQGR